jgi:hypothetical protein
MKRARGQRSDQRSRIGDRSIVIGSVLLWAAAVLCVSLPAASAFAQNPPPPASDPFKALDTPGAPANLTTPPSSSLITPSLLTPSTGVVTPAPGFNGGRMVMRQSVWQEYLSYLHQDVAIGYGFFMITVDGQASDSRQCPNYACQISPLEQGNAVADCQSKRNNRRCIVFAEGRDIKYAYQVVP